MDIKTPDVVQWFEKIADKSEIDAFKKMYQTLPTGQFGIIDIPNNIVDNQRALIIEDLKIILEMKIFPVILADRPIPLNGIQILPTKGKPIQEIIETLQHLLAQNKSVLIHPQYLPGGKLGFIARYIQEIKPKRMVFLNESNGILNKDGQLISQINLKEFDTALENVHPSFQASLTNWLQLIKDDHDTAVVVTGAENLLREIFTIKGAGTYLKAHDFIKESMPSKQIIQKVMSLLEKSFKRPLNTNYDLTENLVQLIYEPAIEGIAIIKKLPTGHFYLDKFCVDPVFAGTGLGRSLFSQIIESFPQIIWRSSPKNPFNQFYFRNSDGYVKETHWMVFWRQIPFIEIPKILPHVIDVPAAFGV